MRGLRTQFASLAGVGLVALLVAACGAGSGGGDTGGGGGSGGGGSSGGLTGNAGADQNAGEGATVNLTGTASNADGSVASVLWAQTSGPAVVLTGATTNDATFTAPDARIGEPLTLGFTFTVTNDAGLSTTDPVQVTVTSTDFLVFRASVVAGDFELWRVRAEPGSPPPVRLSGPLAAGGDVGIFKLSPDGTRVAYLADQETDDVEELYVANVDGSGAPVKVSGALVAGGDVHQDFEWAPDSSRIAYSADQDVYNDTELYTVLPDGTGLVQLNGALAASGDVHSFQWAPDSSRIAYVAGQNTSDVWELYTSLAAGGGNVKLNGLMVLGGDLSPSTESYGWAPDSSRVAYEADQNTDGVTEVFSSLAAGGGNVQVNGPLVANGAATERGWSLDSSRLAYMADQDTDGVVELYIRSGDGGGTPVKVSHAVVGRGVLSFVWGP